MSQDSSFATGVTSLVYIKAVQPALNAACEQGHYKIAEYLLDHGASVNAKSGVSFSWRDILCFVLLPSHRSSKYSVILEILYSTKSILYVVLTLYVLHPSGVGDSSTQSCVPGSSRGC